MGLTKLQGFKDLSILIRSPLCESEPPVARHITYKRCYLSQPYEGVSEVLTPFYVVSRSLIFYRLLACNGDSLCRYKSSKMTPSLFF